MKNLPFSNLLQWPVKKSGYGIGNIDHKSKKTELLLCDKIVKPRHLRHLHI